VVSTSIDTHNSGRERMRMRMPTPTPTPYL
jgi:hypothetical protein